MSEKVNMLNEFQSSETWRRLTIRDDDIKEFLLPPDVERKVRDHDVQVPVL